MQGSFKPEQLEIIQDAIHAVLNVAPFTSQVSGASAPAREVRALAARCVIAEARSGEFDPAVLAQKSSVLFCATQALLGRHNLNS
jgi:hypothetical protein